MPKSIIYAKSAETIPNVAIWIYMRQTPIRMATCRQVVSLRSWRRTIEECMLKVIALIYHTTTADTIISSLHKTPSIFQDARSPHPQLIPVVLNSRM